MIINGTKMCCRCKAVKEVRHFSKQKDKGDGLQGACKECQKETSREYRNSSYRQMDVPRAERTQIHPRIPTAVHAQVKLAAKHSGKSYTYELTELLRIGLAVRQQELIRANR